MSLLLGLLLVKKTNVSTLTVINYYMLTIRWQKWHWLHNQLSNNLVNVDTNRNKGSNIVEWWNVNTVYSWPMIHCKAVKRISYTAELFYWILVTSQNTMLLLMYYSWVTWWFELSSLVVVWKRASTFKTYLAGDWMCHLSIPIYYRMWSTCQINEQLM